MEDDENMGRHDARQTNIMMSTVWLIYSTNKQQEMKIKTIICYSDKSNRDQ